MFDQAPLAYACPYYGDAFARVRWVILCHRSLLEHWQGSIGSVGFFFVFVFFLFFFGGGGGGGVEASPQKLQLLPSPQDSVTALQLL